MRTHGRSPKGLYNTWSSMKDRCSNPLHIRWARYGGRGITVCPDWHPFVKFRAWALSNGWKSGLEIDRINNDGDYTPENCRFVSKVVNNQNRSDTKLTAAIAAEIKKAASAAGANCHAIGREYGVSKTLVRLIRDGKCWREEKVEAEQ